MRWLHLSDLDFGNSSAGIAEIREKVLDLAERVEPVDALFVTGNLVTGGISQCSRLDTSFQEIVRSQFNAYFREAENYLLSLQSRFKVPEGQIFLVPGNHDRFQNTVFKHAISGERKGYSDQRGEIHPDVIEKIQEAEDSFGKVYKNICCEREYSVGHHVCEFGGILCLHTALLSLEREDEKEQQETGLIVGRKLLDKLNADGWRSDTESRPPVIALAHHDFSCLRPGEAEALELKLKDLGAVLYLCGGHPRAHYASQEQVRGAKLRVFGCGLSGPQSKQNTEEASREEASLFIGTIEEGRPSGHIQAYKWRPNVHAWLIDNEFSYQYDKFQVQDGRIYYPERPFDRIPDPTTVWNRYLRYLKRRCERIESEANAVEKSASLSKVFVPLSLDSTSFSGEILRLNRQGSGFRLKSEESGKEAEQSAKGVGLCEAIPRTGRILSCILSETGGGKSTLINWLSCAYGYAIADKAWETHLPPRALYPVWIRCREIPHGALQKRSGALAEVFEKLVASVGDEKKPIQTEEIKEFCDFLNKKAEEGTVFLLIDGLDEIRDQTERKHFVAQLSDYLDTNPKANVLLTTQPSGLNALVESTERESPETSEGEKLGKLNPAFSAFQWYRIAPMDEEQIHLFCEKRLSVSGVHGVGRPLESEIDELLNTPDIRAMAENPMLLTLILMVWRRTGRLHEHKTMLFREALNTLVERWNAEAEKFDADEMICLLSAIAFSMMTNYASQIEESNLYQQIESLLKKRTDLFCHLRSLDKALILLQNGPIFRVCGKSEAGETMYEFILPYMQVYLAALAVVRSCYPEYPEKAGMGEILLPYMNQEHWAMESVIVLTAMMSQPCARLICEELCRNIRESRRNSGQYRHLRHLLLCMLADGVPLTDEAVGKILDCCFQNLIRQDDSEPLACVLHSRYQQLTRKHFKKIGSERFSQVAEGKTDYKDYWDAMLELLSGEYAPSVSSGALTPLQFYWENWNKPDPATRAYALSLLGAALWLPPFRLNGHSFEFRRGIEEELHAHRPEPQQLHDSLVSLGSDDNLQVRMQLLRVLGQNVLLKSLGVLGKSDYLWYLRAYLRVMDELAQIPPRLYMYHVAYALETLCESGQTEDAETFRLSETALDAITSHLAANTTGGKEFYQNLLSVSLLSAACHAPLQKQRRLHDLIRQERERTWDVSPNEENLDDFTHRYAKTLYRMLRSGWIRATEERDAVWGFVRDTHIDMLTHIARQDDPDGIKFRKFLKKLKNSDSGRMEFPYSADTLPGLMREIESLPYMDSDGTAEQ